MNVPCCCSLAEGDVNLSGEARGDTNGEGETKGEKIPPLVDSPTGSPVVPASPPPAAASNNAFN